MSDPATHLDRERKRFEQWMRNKWGGINLSKISTIGDDFEYREAAAQTAWEVWMKFNARKEVA